MASVAGPLHVKNGIPNQDYCLAKRCKWGNIVAVSDGLGSKIHSDIGSREACKAVFEAARCYSNRDMGSFDFLTIDMLQTIHTNWLIKIAPLSPYDCSATCLFAFLYKEEIMLGRLGDGMIAALGKSDKDNLILSENKQESFSNCTECLQEEFKPDKWEVRIINSNEYDAVLLCTDGISDDLVPEKTIAFSQELHRSYVNMRPRKITRDIKRWLNAWPTPGHSDDKTIACLFRREYS